jgi:hypothetical protein
MSLDISDEMVRLYKELFGSRAATSTHARAHSSPRAAQPFRRRGHARQSDRDAGRRHEQGGHAHRQAAPGRHVEARDGVVQEVDTGHAVQVVATSVAPSIDSFTAAGTPYPCLT